MFCRYCGKLLSDDSQYCEFCGKKIHDSIDKEVIVNVEMTEKCRVCGKVFDNNEPKIPMETGGVMCETCDALFRGEEIGPEEEEEFEFIPRDILEVINNKEDYTHEKLKSTLEWLKENECIDEANDLETYLKKQQKNVNFEEEFMDEELALIDDWLLEMDDVMDEDSQFLPQEDEIKIESNTDGKNYSAIFQKQFEYIDIADLKEYLGIVVNMEKDIYLQNSLLSNMMARYERLGKAHAYEEPAAPKDVSSENIFLAIGIGGGFALIGFFLFRWGLQLFNSGLGGFLLGFIVLIFGGTFILTGVICAIYMIVLHSKDTENYLDAKDAYDKACAEYERNIRIDRKRVRKEQIEKAVLASEIKLLRKQNKNSKKDLGKIYSLNIIYPKYRNLIMVCSIYEYICAGRCTTLEGHEGAYNILEMEIRLDRIITKLDLIIAKLDAIQSNQYMLYSAIQETNQQVEHILKSTDDIANSLKNFQGQTEELRDKIISVEKNSGLATYQAESMQKELHYMNRMNYLSGKYDNVFYNAPPS